MSTPRIDKRWNLIGRNGLIDMLAWELWVAIREDLEPHEPELVTLTGRKMEHPMDEGVTSFSVRVKVVDGENLFGEVESRHRESKAKPRG